MISSLLLALTLAVSPSGTSPQSAVDSIRAQRTRGSLPKTERATITFKPGVYHLTAPLVLGPDVGPVAFVGGSNVVFSGGMPVTGWMKQADGTWRARVPVGTRSRQLTVNGVRAIRCRTPNVGAFEAAGEETPFNPQTHTHSAGKGQHPVLVYNPKDIDFAALKSPETAEIRVFHWWVDSHLQIGRVDSAAHKVWFKVPADFYIGKMNIGDRKPGLYCVENVREFLDAPGEWFLDPGAGTLDYLPRPGEDPKAPSFSAVLAQQEELMEITGSDITFRGMTFRDADAELKEGDINSAQGSSTIPAALRLAGAKDVRFVNCTFEALDGFAVDIKAGTQRALFDHCLFSHLGAGALRMDGGTFKDSPLLATRENVIQNCEIGDYGLDWASAVGLLVMNASDNRIVKNHIHDGYYTAVSVGWSWGYGDSVSARNLVAYNLIEDIGKGLLNDMGGIYTLGHSPGTIIRGNLVRHIRRWCYGGHAYYADEGSQGILIERNLLYDAPDVINIHYARELTFRDNIVAQGQVSLVSLGKPEDHVTAYFTGNVFDFGFIRPYWGNGMVGPTYDYCYSPYSGLQKRSEHVLADWNLFYSTAVSSAEGEHSIHGAAGKDNPHSVWSDPLFVDPAKGDFRFKPNSPALKLGIRPFDYSAVGL